MLTRRSAMIGTSSLALGSLKPLSSAIAKPSEGGPLPDRALLDDVTRYVGFGNHRTGGPGEQATALWIESELAAAGLAVETQPFATPVYPVGSGSIAIGGWPKIDLLPQPPTASCDIRATLIEWHSDLPADRLSGKIVVYDAPFARHSSLASSRFRDVLAACDANARALVIVTNGPTEDALLLNAERDLSTLPVAVVAPTSAAPLLAAARGAANARISLTQEVRQSQAQNIIGRHEGTGRAVVVSTPISGWGPCAGERGPGVAIFLHLVRNVAPRLSPELDLIFVATSAHEIDHVGARSFLEAKAPAPDRTALWIHLGAGLAARDWHDAHNGSLLPLPSADPQRYLGATEDLVEIARNAFAGLPGLEQSYAMTGETAAGELRDVLKAGYPSVIGGFGAHRFHHSQRDDMRCIVPLPLLAAAQAFERVTIESCAAL